MKSEKRKRWVIKVGSNSFCSGGPILVRAWMQQVHTLRKKYKVDVVWVTSGAIASARDRLFTRRPKVENLAQKQALSAIGQPYVMDLYNVALQSFGLMGAQILLTYDDLVNGERKKNFQNTLKQLLSWQVVPVLNENDAVATEEIKFGDNDSLSAKVAIAIGASRLILMTDVAGLFDRDPVKYENARLMTEIPDITERHLRAVAGNKKSARGTGGMLSKLCAAQEAAKACIPTWLVRADLPSVLTDIAQNKKVGTFIGQRTSKA